MSHPRSLSRTHELAIKLLAALRQHGGTPMTSKDLSKASGVSRLAIRPVARDCPRSLVELPGSRYGAHPHLVEQWAADNIKV
jgi:hypothetical protein